MHFWMTKPAGRYYGFTGRRYPATPLPKARSTQNQCRYRGSDFRQMVTPVHRFQSLHSRGNVAGPSNTNSCSVVRPGVRTNNENQNITPVGSIQPAQLNNNPNNVTNAGNNQLILSNTTPNTANRSLLDFSEFSDAELAGYRLRCGVWITFVLATGFVAVAKFYFGHQGPGLEILVFCGLLTLLLSACLYSILCRRNHHSNHHQEHHVQEEHTAPLANASTTSSESIRSVPVIRPNPPPPPPPPPPPYHIAILIPPPDISEEAPPPSYDKVMR